MATAFSTAVRDSRPKSAAPHGGTHLLANVVMALALLVIIVPTLYNFAIVFWLVSDDTHAPIVLAGLVYGFWRERDVFDWSSSGGEKLAASGVGLLAAILYVLGRSQGFYQLEGVGAIGFVLAAVILVGGRRALRRLGYLTILLLFVVPVPGAVANNLLVPLKKMLSNGVVGLFSTLGYPVANHGVILSVGFYQLQIADACAGLRSLLSLSAMGLLFVHFVPSTSRRVTVLLLVLIPFIALAANFTRVSSLVLVTYYFGGDVGERAHNSVAYLEIVIALLMFLGVHALLERVLGKRPATLA
jgi:exosortase